MWHSGFRPCGRVRHDSDLRSIVLLGLNSDVIPGSVRTTKRTKANKLKKLITCVQVWCDRGRNLPKCSLIVFSLVSEHAVSYQETPLLHFFTSVPERLKQFTHNATFFSPLSSLFIHLFWNFFFRKYLFLNSGNWKGIHHQPHVGLASRSSESSLWLRCSS